MIVRCDSIPDDAKKADHCIVAYGEATGHAHRIEKGAAQYVTASGQQWIEVMQERAELIHQEHHTIVLPAGKYQIVHQREYSPEANRAVMD